MMKNKSRVLALIFIILLSSLATSSATAQTSIIDVRVIALSDSEDDLRVSINEKNSVSINIYNEIGELTNTLNPNFNTGGILALDWNSDSNRISAIYSTDLEQPNLIVWDVVTETIIAQNRIDFARFVYWHPFNPNQMLVLLGSTIVLWDLSNSNTLMQYDPLWIDIEHVEWSPNGQHIALIGEVGNVRILDAQTLSVVFEVFENLPVTSRTHAYFSLAFSPNEDKVALYDLLNTEIEIWDLATNQQIFVFDSFATTSQHYESLRWFDIGIVGIDIRLGEVVLYDSVDGSFDSLLSGISYSRFYVSEFRKEILFMPSQIENNESFFIRLTLPSISLNESDTSTIVTESGATDTYTLTLGTQPTADVVVSVTGTDQIMVSPVALTFTQQNWDVPQTVTVSAVDDSVVEGDHAPVITHSAVSADAGYNGISVADVTVTITDNDSAGVTITELDGDTAVVEDGAIDTYTVALTSQPTANVVITASASSQAPRTPILVRFLRQARSRWVVLQAVEQF